MSEQISSDDQQDLIDRLTRPLLLFSKHKLAGALSSRKKAMLPIAAAVGGMAVPAGVF